MQIAEDVVFPKITVRNKHIDTARINAKGA